MPPVITSTPGNGFTSPSGDFDEYNENEQATGPVPRIDSDVVSITQTGDGKQRLDVRAGVDQNDVVTRGSTTVTPGAAPQAVVQYTIVFDNPAQQARWYEFIKWLKSDVSLVGVTTAERLIDFIDQHIGE